MEIRSKILVIDDEEIVLDSCIQILSGGNYDIQTAENGLLGVQMVEEFRPDLIFVDLKMPGINGIEVLKQTKKSNPNIEVIILTGHGSEADRETCMNLGAFAYLQKPADIEKLSSTITAAYEKIAGA